MPPEPENVPVAIAIDLPSDVELGVFADFANLWHTPNTFVIDFLSVKRPPARAEGDAAAKLPARVAARVRIPPEQIFPLIEALQVQGQQWLAETGRSEPPSSWVPSES